MLPRILALLLIAGLTRLFSAATVSAAETELVDLAEQRAWKQVAQRIAEGADVNARQADGMTALHWASFHDHLETARQLIAAGADVEVANRYGVRCLSVACLNGNAQLVEQLLAAGADPNTQLAGGETALMTAARTGRVDVIKALLGRGAEVNRRERRGQTALMWAAAEGHADVVQMLLEAGADIRVRLASGFTALQFAVREGQTESVRTLLAAGADVQAIMEPETPFPRVPRRGTSALIVAVENGHFALALELIRAGADPNDQRSGYTALHTLTWVRKPNRGDGEDGDPPPRGSGEVNSLEFVRELVALGADVNAQLERGASGRGVLGKTGATPFLMAAATDDVPLMRTLLELGADPHRPNAEGCTPLMAAAGVGVLAPGEEAGTPPEAAEAVAFLLDLGADPNVVDENGETAMHGAAYKSVPKVVELLAARGAKIDLWNRPNKAGWTPLMIAEGYRPGNFKPSPDTGAALRRVMKAAGVTPPKSVKPDRETPYDP